MPWHQEPKKDVVSCEKPWGAANKLRSMDVRMGKPGGGNAPSLLHEYIVYEREPGELKHLSSRRKRKKQVSFSKETSISKVAASEMERGQTEMRAFRGSDCTRDSSRIVERFWDDRSERVKTPYTKFAMT